MWVKGGTYQPGTRPHLHQPTPGELHRLRMRKQVKTAVQQTSLQVRHSHCGGCDAHPTCTSACTKAGEHDEDGKQEKGETETKRTNQAAVQPTRKLCPWW